MTEMAAKLKTQMTEQKVKYETVIKEMKKEVHHDIGIIDLELKRQTSGLKEQVAKLESKLMKSA